MTISGYIALGVILFVIIALVKEIMRPGLILFSALVVFLVFDILSPQRSTCRLLKQGYDYSGPALPGQ